MITVLAYQYGVDYIHVKPEKAWKEILDTEKQSLDAFIFSWWHAAAPLRKFFSDSVIAEKKAHDFEKADFWAVLPAQTLALSGG